MPVDELNHYNLRVPAAAQARVIEFYERMLGFEFRQNGRLLWLWRGERPLVHLTIVAEASMSAQPAGAIDHIAFSCRGLAAMQASFGPRRSLSCEGLSGHGLHPDGGARSGGPEDRT